MHLRIMTIEAQWKSDSRKFDYQDDGQLILTNLIYLFSSGTNEFESLIELIHRLSQLDKDQKLVDHHFRSWHLHLWNDHELQGSHSTSFLKRKKKLNQNFFAKLNAISKKIF
jgi:hypothetical protein